MGGEGEDSERARSFEKYGQFNLKRIAPNAMMYLAEPPPVGAFREMRAPFEAAYDAPSPSVRGTRLEEPNLGMLFIWPLWLLLAAVGLGQRALRRMPGAAGLAAVTIGSLLMLSHVTVTMRYHIDLWPIVALPALIGVRPLAAWGHRSRQSRSPRTLLLLLLLVTGFTMTPLLVGGARNSLLEVKGL